MWLGRLESATRTHLRLVLRNVKALSATAFALLPSLCRLRFTAVSMTYPFGAARTELEKSFALPSVPPTSELESGSGDHQLCESDLAVALFEHPDH